MKNSLMKILFSLFLVAIANEAFSSAVTSEKRLQDAIRNKLLTSTSVLGELNNRYVDVSFSVDEEGHVTVVKSTGSDEEINMYVFHKLNNLRLDKGQFIAGTLYTCRIVFRKI